MIRSFFLLLLFVISLQALSNSELLNRADGFMKTGSQSNQFRAYNDYKNLYLKAIMEEDSKLRVSSLRGIVKSGNKLHIDVEQYSTELKKLTNKKIYKKPKSNKKIKKAKKIQIKSSHKLKSINWKNGKLVLKFDKKLKNNQINYFILYDAKKKIHRYVFDVHASMLTKSQNLKKDGISRIKLAQYKPNTLRLVIENSSKVKVSFKKKNNSLIVSMKSTAKVSEIAKNYTQRKVDKTKIIVIDAGHGGKDPGAVGYKKYREKVVVFKIAKDLKKILKSRGYKVFMTREKDIFVKLSKRTKYANRKNADIFVSIHANAVDKIIAEKAYGIECYFLSPSRSDRAKRVAAQENSADLSDMNKYGKNSFLNLLNHHNILASNKLAIDLQRGMLGLLNKEYKNVKDGGVREGPFWVLVGAQMPSVLVEVGFISNSREAKRLVKDKYRKTIAKGLANGIERYFANCN
ncbi:N-acetylmuramoyl-L-alanine amidase [Candidatus Sulfurimonas marisnigri]|uniref:N-acetylmuramoyl-L-alanine amidase n=1 Tax=Candidatus Sulfurimonas marisnigri TaxID=2740405 RepID=A0A7S7M1V5_9BACT|nr:N-acetylmuramoyl-L-alanine amidase [Candidatus Sulfurimonas marisnigri]QOY55493.1 N-acetylmuramoyl-L-alanine amidase [Candidatus Sulfurimonas marisnigri]